MRIPRIYLDSPLHCEQETELSEDAARHIIKVLRFKVGYRLKLFNGDGHDYNARLIQVDRRRATVLIEDRTATETESPLDIELVQAIGKGERMDYAVQKSVELGVRQIVPLISEHTVVRLDDDRGEKRRQHWQAVAISACEQCGRGAIPQVQAVTDLQEWLQTRSRSAILLDPTATDSLKTLEKPQDGLSILVGPEGGFSFDEIAQAKAAGVQAIRLGPRVLRSETAGPAVLAILQTLWGDLD